MDMVGRGGDATSLPIPIFLARLFFFFGRVASGAAPPNEIPAPAGAKEEVVLAVAVGANEVLEDDPLAGEVAAAGLEG